MSKNISEIINKDQLTEEDVKFVAGIFKALSSNEFVLSEGDDISNVLYALSELIKSIRQESITENDGAIGRIFLELAVDPTMTGLAVVDLGLDEETILELPEEAKNDDSAPSGMDTPKTE